MTLGAPLIVIASVAIVTFAAWAMPALKGGMILLPQRVVHRYEVHRLLTAGWLHADVTHLFFNMLTLWFFADDVVKVLGPVRFLILYVSSVVVGFIPTTLRHMNNPRYSSLGASGAVAAVMFGAILLQPGLKVSLYYLPMRIPGILYALGYLAYSVWHSWRSRDGINHDAHFSGAIYGAALSYLFEPARVTRTVSSFF